VCTPDVRVVGRVGGYVFLLSACKAGVCVL
jgi:hypothetical protein